MLWARLGLYALLPIAINPRVFPIPGWMAREEHPHPFLHHLSSRNPSETWCRTL